MKLPYRLLRIFLSSQLIAITLSPLAPLASETQSSNECLKKKVLPRLLGKTVDTLYAVAKPTVHGVFYPILGPINGFKLARNAYQEGGIAALRKVPGQWLHRDKLPAAIFTSLMLLRQGTIITDEEFESQTADFNPGNSNVFVFVNAIQKSDPIYEITRDRFENNYGKRPAPITFYLEPKDHESLRQSLIKIRAMTGKKISRMEIHAHGSPGVLSLQGKRYEASYFYNVRTTDLFEENAKIRLSSCLLANGEQGRSLMNAIGESFLDQGGEVIGSSVVVRTSLIDSATAALGLPPSGDTVNYYERWLVPQDGVEGALRNASRSSEGLFVIGRVRRAKIFPAKDRPE